MRDDPILVLGAGQRCGSTLVQRLLTSLPGVLVWGESGAIAQQILQATGGLNWWTGELAAPAREAFAAEGHQGWIANLLPPPEVAPRAARAFLDEVFARPAEELGRPRWGFKEVRVGLGLAHELRRLYPGLTAVHLTRDPRDMLRSIAPWGWELDRLRDEVVGSWVAVNRSVLDVQPRPEWVRSWRYEDLVADPAAFMDDLAGLLGVGSDDFDATVFDLRVARYEAGYEPPPAWDELPRKVRALVAAPEVREVAAALGYDG